MNNVKTILVTGGAGFVGSHLCERLVKDGHRVISLDNYFTGSRDNHVAGVTYIDGHTKDIASLITEKPDLVYHLGEYSRVEKSLQDPIEMVWDLNKTGTFAVLEFCRENNCKISYAGSSTKFGDDGDNRDATPYGWTKATNTELVKNYSRWYGLEYAITYFYNVYGPRERSNAYGTAIAIFAEQYKSGQPITVVAPGTQERNFTHVHDIADGLVRVGLNGTGDGFAIGGNKAFSILEVARLFGGDIVMLPERAGNRMTSDLDISRITSLGWKQKHSLEDFLHEVISSGKVVKALGSKVLVISTTFAPEIGPAEQALIDLMKSMSNVHFDVVTACTDKTCPLEENFSSNVRIHRVGRGTKLDKYFLPYYGYKKAFELHRKEPYLFVWSLMASYAALAGIFFKNKTKTPMMITLADQRIDRLPWLWKKIVSSILNRADQVFATNTSQETKALSLSRKKLRTTIGSADAFANQLRYAYIDILRSVKK